MTPSKEQPDSHGPRSAIAVALVFSLLGACLSSYSLLSLRAALADGRAELSLCGANSGASCAAAHLSRFGYLLGTPVSLLGVAYYLWSSTVAGWALLRRSSADALRALWLSAPVLLAVTVYLGLTLYTVLGTSCLICGLTYLVNVGFVVSLYAAMRGVSAHERRSPLHPSRWWLDVQLALVRPVAGASLVALWGVVLLAMGLGRTWETARTGLRRALVLDLVASLTDQSPVEVGDLPGPRKGSDDAPVSVVVFSDFQCQACAWTAESLRAPHLAVAVRYVHFPVDPAVNHRVTHDGHAMAGVAALCGIVAERRGWFWEYQEDVYAHRDRLDDTFIEQWFAERGVSPEDLRSELAAPWLAQQFDAHLAAGDALDVTAAPTIFVNGYRLPGYSDELLNAMIQHELQRAGAAAISD